MPSYSDHMRDDPAFRRIYFPESSGRTIAPIRGLLIIILLSNNSQCKYFTAVGCAKAGSRLQNQADALLLVRESMRYRELLQSIMLYRLFINL